MKGHQQPTGRAQSPLSSAFPIIILLDNFLSSTLKVLVDGHGAQKRFHLESCQGLRSTPVPAVSFLVPPDGPKNGTVKVLFLVFLLLSCGVRSQKWDRQAVPFLGPCLGSFFEVFCIRVAEAQSFGFNETLWLMATGRATREALLSEAGFEEVFPDPELGPSEQAVL